MLNAITAFWWKTKAPSFRYTFSSLTLLESWNSKREPLGPISGRGEAILCSVGLDSLLFSQKNNSITLVIVRKINCQWLLSPLWSEKLPQSHKIPCMWSIIFLKFVISFKMKTSDPRLLSFLKTNGKRKHYTAVIELKDLTMRWEVVPIGTKEVFSYLALNMYLWKWYKLHSFIHSINMPTMPAICEALYQGGPLGVQK